MNLVPEHRRPKSREKVLRQNRFARRYGLSILNVSANLVLASIALTLCYQLTLYMYDSGVLTMSQELRDRVGAE